MTFAHFFNLKICCNSQTNKGSSAVGGQRLASLIFSRFMVYEINTEKIFVITFTITFRNRKIFQQIVRNAKSSRKSV